MYIETGKPLDAIISAELLMNIFTPSAPLHDGAVIIQADRIAAAGTFLPLSVERRSCRSITARAIAPRSASARRPTPSSSWSPRRTARSASPSTGGCHENLKPAELAHLLPVPPQGRRGKIPRAAMIKRFGPQARSRSLVAVVIWLVASAEPPRGSVSSATSPVPVAVVGMPGGHGARRASADETVKIRVRGPDAQIRGLTARESEARRST